MTMSRQVNSREMKIKRRALSPVKAAADRISFAIKNQITVLSNLRLKSRETLQLDHVTAIQTLADTQLKASNEVKKLHALINQLVPLREHLSKEDSRDKKVASILSLLDSLEATAQDEINAYIEELEDIKQKTSPALLSANSNDSSSNGLLYHLSSLPTRSGKWTANIDASSEFYDLSAEAKEVMGERSATVLLTEEMENRRKLAGAWKTLQRDIQDLNETFKRVAASVWIQGEVVNRIEENVAASTSNVNHAAVTLSKITKNSALPLICAAVGTAFAGPIGFVAGYKLAAVAALGTASLGYMGGKAVQKVTNPPAIEAPPPVTSANNSSSLTTESQSDESSQAKSSEITQL